MQTPVIFAQEREVNRVRKRSRRRDEGGMWRTCRSMEMKRPGPPGTSLGGTAYAHYCSKSVQNMIPITVQNVSLLYYGGILVVLRDGQVW